MGKIIDIGASEYVGRVWQYNEDEDAALEYLPHTDQVLYLRGLRKNMDFSSGIVGVRRAISYQMFKELLEVNRKRGSTKPSYAPTKDELRACIARLIKAGLIERLHIDTGSRIERLVFKLPLAHVGYRSAPSEEPQLVAVATPPAETSDVAGPSAVVNPSGKNGLNPIHQLVSKSDIKEIRENSSELSHSASQDSVIVQSSKAVNQDAKSKQSSPKQSNLGTCPHHEVLELWAKYFPGKSQPNKNLWDQQTASQHLKARWREVSMIMHSTGTRTLYATREEGLQWWEEFFQYISVRCLFLMSDDSQFFNLAWLVKKANFMKTLDQNYEVRK